MTEPDSDPTTFTIPPELDVDLIWLNAITKLPNAKPLVELLRGDLPVPLGIRDLLAELLDPDVPDIMGGKLIYKKTSGIERAISELRAVFDYYKLRDKGELSQEAAVRAGEIHRITDRTVYNYIRSDYLRRLGARLRGK